MKFIVTTTINSPTEALIKFSEMKDWKLVVVGDLKTPMNEYNDLDCIYLDLNSQNKINPALSELIGFNSLERRNFGYIYAYKNGAKIIASVDDDNIPLENWGKNLLINKPVDVDFYETEEIAFDPLSVTNISNLWHRGFPIELLHRKNLNLKVEKRKLSPHIQADLWNGDPDIDAICRITFSPEVEINKFRPFSTNKYSPFNTQNTFFSAEIIKYFMQLPFVGRMSDIWGSYLIQKNITDLEIVYNNASVYQKRNPHNLSIDLEEELLGYRHTLNYLTNNYQLPEKTVHAYQLYKKSFA
tara:strand:+ start:36908 stop:37804 length:897 start_codon:yes stop_codon:yes gene_type:complete